MFRRRLTPVIRSLLLAGALSVGAEARPLATSSAALAAEQPKAANLELVLNDLAGQAVRLNQFKGRVIVLNLWATWCGPCRKEIPDLIKLQATYPDDVTVIGIVIQDKFGENVKKVVREFGIRYPVVDGNDHTDFERAYGPFWALPISIVIDRQGLVRKKHQGQVTLEQLQREIRPLIPR